MYVPDSMEKNVIFKYRQGITKVYETLRKSYWFPDMKNKFTDHINNCCKCIAFTMTSGKIEGNVNVIRKGDKPFEMLYVYQIDIFNSRVKAKKHILVLMAHILVHSLNSLSCTHKNHEVGGNDFMFKKIFFRLQ